MHVYVKYFGRLVFDKKHSQLHHFDGHVPLNDLLPLGDRRRQGWVSFTRVLDTGLESSKIFMLEAVCYAMAKHGGLLIVLSSLHWMWRQAPGWGRASGRRSLPYVQLLTCPPGRTFSLGASEDAIFFALGLLEVCAPAFLLCRALGGVISTKVELVSYLPIFISTWIQGWGTNFLPCCTQNLEAV